MCGITTAGTITCFGANDSNQATPPQPATRTYKHIASGYYHACAIGTDNLTTCWGYNQYGQSPAQ